MYIYICIYIIFNYINILYLFIYDIYIFLQFEVVIFLTVKVRRDAVTWNSAADAVSRKRAGADWALSLRFFWHQKNGILILPWN